MRRKGLRTLIKIINILAAFVMMFCVSCLDSDNYWPFLAGILICGAWLLLVLYATDYSTRKKADHKIERRKSA